MSATSPSPTSAISLSPTLPSRGFGLSPPGSLAAATTTTRRAHGASSGKVYRGERGNEKKNLLVPQYLPDITGPILTPLTYEWDPLGYGPTWQWVVRVGGRGGEGDEQRSVGGSGAACTRVASGGWGLGYMCMGS